MSTLQQLRQDLSQAWGQVRNGWHRLAGQAAGALTRFTGGGKGLAVREGAVTGGIWDWSRGSSAWGITWPTSGWGVLAADVLDQDDKVH